MLRDLEREKQIIVSPNKNIPADFAMGVKLAPLIVKKMIRLRDLHGKSLAVDANNMLYQFLALIRKPDGALLKDSEGNVTSHLVGLMYRSTRLIHDYDLDLVFVFDGKPSSLKNQEILKRRKLREKARLEWKKALKMGDYASAFSKAVMTGRLTKPMVNDAKRLLRLLGIPFVQAPSEAEAQTACMALRGDVWASSSRDYDSLLFGAPRLLRYLTFCGREFLPSKRSFRPLKPELITLEKLLSRYGLTREQLIDLAILVGTDFNEGIRGIGPKIGLKLVKKYGRLENLPQEIKSKISSRYEIVRKIFSAPEVTSDYVLEYGDLQEEALYDFLCDQRDFSRRGVETAVHRMKKFYTDRRQAGLKKWLFDGDQRA